jgi:hypothetical protein
MNRRIDIPCCACPSFEGLLTSIDIINEFVCRREEAANPLRRHLQSSSNASDDDVSGRNGDTGRLRVLKKLVVRIDGPSHLLRPTNVVISSFLVGGPGARH